MKNIFSVGDKKEYQFVVTDKDVAAFHGKVVHPVCSTFTIAREAEWTTRQFVIDLKEEHEEGIGTFVTVEHKAPAKVGSTILFEAWIERLEQNEIVCRYQASVQHKVVATGTTGQKVFAKEKIEKLLNS
ncbi:MAG: thioesterase family protein [Chryseotalea sp.]